MNNQEPLSTFGLIFYVWNHWNDIQNQWSVVTQIFVQLLGAVVALASMITPITKTPKDDELLGGLKKWMHQLSITNAKNVTGVGQDNTVLPTPSKPKEGFFTNENKFQK